ncbi:diaminopimelate epimerase [Desulfobacter hydrogenophilus]|uniref:Diaminopimelate epimerase n=1 Tax=Desulfobacter hydrogenophilus TaxID=2291 RepID=A0A328FDX5_9BACT|nr:diaminopimelate epimerase [Desulfobacter hydrogenophilus]NDY71048.1 diaminopimelate epimerase [Desulfobacter hydrogenophilus]QBH11691.1 diaminopimelate epimerase [Desulfobacter hydrogenophilus]RAM02904.1 diaminopimelate epimerase [Desulfobacter hydrogenophilus]
MHIDFWKMHGLGNDFIMLDDRDKTIAGHIDYSDLAVHLCHRRFGIGADGIILARHSDTHDIRFVIINSDGSQPEMCGNGMRCFAKYLYENNILVKDEIKVQTLAGTVVPRIEKKQDAQVVSVCVDMGVPRLIPEQIPFVYDGKMALGVPIETGQGTMSVSCVSMGNPHAVIFVNDLSLVDIEVVGPMVENHPRFPEKTNVEFIEVISDSQIKMRVWERGAGVTLACGTGACAAVTAAHLTGWVGRQVRVHLDGGDLDILWDESSGHIFKTGPAQTVFKGTVEI